MYFSYEHNKPIKTGNYLPFVLWLLLSIFVILITSMLSDGWVFFGVISPIFLGLIMLFCTKYKSSEIILGEKYLIISNRLIFFTAIKAFSVDYRNFRMKYTLLTDEEIFLSYDDFKHPARKQDKILKGQKKFFKKFAERSCEEIKNHPHIILEILE